MTTSIKFLLLLGTLCLASTARAHASKADIVVAQDGTGNYTTVQEAIDAVPKNHREQTILFIKPGTYKEKLKVPADRRNLKLLGESYENTILTYDDHAKKTKDYASTRVYADDFFAENVTFQNTINSRKWGSQAAALRVDGDRAMFYKCKIMGFQDTYYTGGNKRSYHKDCIIEGTTDFIYGNGIALFEGCTIINRKDSHITAHSQKLNDGKPVNKFGYVFNRCDIKVHPDEAVSNASLGRPWGNAARVVYLNCHIGAHVRHEGWSEWRGRNNHQTAYYAEYKNSGPGSKPNDRLPWTHQLTDEQAAIYTKENIFKANTTTAVKLDGDWNPVVEDITEDGLAQPAPPNAPVYLMSTFDGSKQDGLRFAYSLDGYLWKRAPGLFLRPEVGNKIMRDPSICQGPDKTWHLVWTTGWKGTNGIGYAHSKDLVHWSPQQYLPVMEHEPNVCNVWAPELFYDDQGKQFIICWASTIPGRFPDYLESATNNHRMYYTTTPDFKAFTPTSLFMDPDFSVIDCYLLRAGGRYVVLLKDNTRPHRNLRVAFGDTPLGPWQNMSPTLTAQFTEGPSALKIGEDWLIYYEHYREKQYRALKTSDFKSFTNVTSKMTFPKELKHGTVFTATQKDLECLMRFSQTKDTPKTQVLTSSMATMGNSDVLERPRVIITSDFPPINVVKGGNVPDNQKSDPDDMQSMVRFLLYANEFDIEGLIAAAGTFAMEAHKKYMLDVLDRYEMVYKNLKSHDPEYPTADTLRSVTYEGLGNNHGLGIEWGSKTQPVTDIIGEGKDSEASNAIIAAADKPNPRPLWIAVWGTPREVSQAIWRVRNDRSEDEFKAFISKLRLFLIAYQDCTHGWLMDEFPDLFIIDSRKTYQGMFGGRDPISNLAWVNDNIRHNHGPLCDIYPHEGMGCTGVCEGDSPTFMYLVSANRGINNSEDPTQPSWGGQYQRKANTRHYVDGPGRSSISTWRKDYQKEFAERADWCVEPVLTDESATSTARGPIAQKPRIINTTDLGADPDDEQSMVRYLVCSNEFETEGLIVSTGCWKKSQSSTGMLDKIVDAYAQVYDNLKNHADGYPTPDYLKSISVMGQRGYGMGDVGDGKDSPGSEMIIAAVDKDDPRPVWIGGWGGVNNVAQAIWKVRETRSPAELKNFIGKLRVFDILGQDDAGAWLAKNFPGLFYIRATGVYGWQPSKNDPYLRTHIQSHGPLGAVYPNTKWATEGDTPAFMHVYPNGLNDPEQIDQGGWGGRFSFKKQEGIRSMSEVKKIRKDGETRYDPYTMYGNTPEKAGAIKRWIKGYSNDFEARMDWTMTGDYSKVNHHPVAVLNGDKTKQVLEVSASAGSSRTLSAKGSSDPDDDSLVYSWSFYKEPSSYKGSVSIQNQSSQSASMTIPVNARGKTIHIILELHDNGTPNLYAYRRVIINVQ